MGTVNSTMDDTKTPVLMGLFSGRTEKPRETGKNPDKLTGGPKGDCMGKDRRGREAGSAEMPRAVDCRTGIEQRNLKVEAGVRVERDRARGQC